ncbi:hypothetical protein EYC84_000399 [Monilinia fructicola]|uniref:Major facilitator superfamily (MFS) profile domain-containing protein n=1 Tax=Monilinia fructicola TaxID=38448 RepID=A0A5M9JRJ0_MONFR|nr:hypothetical protein EYC84_000399 [Monilinia fructicola]
MCKIPEIQGPLATIRGWKSFGDTVPVLLVAIPIGSFGDRYGRRKIMALSLIGVGLSLVEIFVVCAFPKTFDLRWVWLSSVFLLCGGGLYSSAAFMFAMASSLIPEDTRSYAFYYIFSAFCIAELVGSYIASIRVSILAAGFGLRVSTLSLVSHFIPPTSIATSYASIAVLENLGHAITDPSMQHIFAATLRLPPFWHALPFFITAICYSLAVTLRFNRTHPISSHLISSHLVYSIPSHLHHSSIHPTNILYLHISRLPNYTLPRHARSFFNFANAPKNFLPSFIQTPSCSQISFVQRKHSSSLPNNNTILPSLIALS